MTLEQLEVIHAERAAQREADLREMEAKTQAMLDAFRALPVIITGPGDFRTRDGRRVTIHTISPVSGGATGQVWKEFRGKLRPRGNFGWEVNGRVSFREEHKRDIVGPWVEALAQSK